MKRFILAIVFVVSATSLYLAQDRPGKLASLIQAGNRLAALDMIQAGADVNEAQPDGTRPIHWAVYRVDHELMTGLIARDAQVDVINELGSTPLAEAVKLNDPEMVRMLLDAGSGSEGANPEGQTALMLAIKSGDLGIVRMLVDAGADCQRRRAGSGPDTLDLGRRRDSKRRRDGGYSSCKWCRRERPRQIHRLAESDHVRAPLAVPRVRRLDGPLVTRPAKAVTSASNLWSAPAPTSMCPRLKV